MKRCLIAAFVVLALQSVSPAMPTAEELLDQYAETADKAFSSFICQSKSEIAKNDHFVGQFAFRNGQRTIHRLQEIRLDGPRVKLINQQWGDIFKNDSPASIPESQKGIFIYLNDGQQQYQHNRTPQHPGYVIIESNSFDEKKAAILIAHSVHVAPCFGYLQGDYKRFDRILKEADPENVSVQASTERINGTAHYVIEADTDNGTYRIWLNPEKGYNFTKAVLQKKEGQAFNDGPLRPGDDFLFRMENIEFAQIDGVWIPVKAKMEYSYQLPNGGASKETISCAITSLIINPDHDALGSFLADDIQNGAQVIISGEPRAKFIWQNGKPVPQTSR